MPPAHPPAAHDSSVPSGALWRTIILLFVSVIICSIDRSNLSLAVPLLKDELGLEVSRVGVLLSAFFWTYASFQLIAGWLVDRYNAGWVLAAGFLMWSVATAATGLAGGFGSLLLFRLLLGIGESVAYPAYAKIFATYFTEGQRGLANSLIDAGSKVGPAIGTLVGGFYMAHFGWRTFFLVLGVGAFPWVLCWVRWMPRGAERTARTGDPRIGEILCHRSAWATFVGLFCGNYFLYFLITWLPYYLVHDRHFSMGTMAVAGALPFVCSAAATTTAGWLSYRALAAGMTPTLVRKTCTVVGLGFAAIIVMVPLIKDARGATVVLMLASASYGIYSTSPWAIAQTIAGPLAAGRWAGMQNFVGNLSGVVAPALTGLVVERTGSFVWAFGLTAGVVLIGAMVYLFVLGRVEPATWRYQASS
jgi:MFS transporter, ACS family, D-galactonate transporter